MPRWCGIPCRCRALWISYVLAVKPLQRQSWRGFPPWRSHISFPTARISPSELPTSRGGGVMGTCAMSVRREAQTSNRGEEFSQTLTVNFPAITPGAPRTAKTSVPPLTNPLNCMKRSLVVVFHQVTSQWNCMKRWPVVFHQVTSQWNCMKRLRTSFIRARPSGGVWAGVAAPPSPARLGACGVLLAARAKERPAKIAGSWGKSQSFVEARALHGACPTYLMQNRQDGHLQHGLAAVQLPTGASRHLGDLLESLNGGSVLPYHKGMDRDIGGPEVTRDLHGGPLVVGLGPEVLSGMAGRVPRQEHHIGPRILTEHIQ